MDDLMREVARRHQAEMRARAAEDHAAARLERARSAMTGGRIRRSMAWLARYVRPLARPTPPLDGRTRSAPSLSDGPTR